MFLVKSHFYNDDDQVKTMQGKTSHKQMQMLSSWFKDLK